MKIVDVLYLPRLNMVDGTNTQYMYGYGISESVFKVPPILTPMAALKV
jgi:hypothetical protein